MLHCGRSKEIMKARNKHTGKECEIYWEMCDTGRECQASDKPITPAPCIMYNAVVDDYDFLVDDQWVDGLEYIKNIGKYRELTQRKRTKIIFSVKT